VRFGFWLIAGAVILVDQVTKFIVEAKLPLNGVPVPVIPGLLSFTHVQNSGVAFGQLSGAGAILIVAALVAAAAIIRYRAKLLEEHGTLHPTLMVGLALPLGGAIGNMVDRIRLGRVVDFLDVVTDFPVFNIADSAITVGAGLLLIYFLFMNQPAPAPRPAEIAEVPDSP
jgi:signal peptidase II